MSVTPPLGSGAIRVGFAVPDTSIPRWHALAIERLLSVAGVEPALRIAAPAPSPPSGPALYQRWVAAACREPALQPTSIPPAVRALPRAADLNAAARAVDLILWLAELPEAARPRPAELCIWGFAFGPRGSRSATVPGTWELALGEAVTEGALVSLGSANDTAVVLRRGAVRTEPMAEGATAQLLLRRMAEWPAQLCLSLVSGERMAGAPKALEPAGGRVPGNRDMLRAYARVALRPGARALRTLFRHDHWNVGLVRTPISSFLRSSKPAPVEWLPAPPVGRFFADPFGVRRPGGITVLCEELDYARGTGRIVALDWPDRASPAPVPVGDSAHRSYPYLFELEGAIWCIPETHQSREIVLHRAEEFPTRWRRERVLLRDVAAVDTTLFQHEGRWWLAFGDTDVAEHENLFLWHAPDLAGPWRPHTANPVKTDPRSCRPAGTPFRHEGNLYRPAQDCSLGYGRRIAINLVRELTPTRYEEEPVAWVDADPDSPWPSGIHTLSAVGDYTLIDSKRVTFSLKAAVANFRAMGAKRMGALRGSSRTSGEQISSPAS